jgi:hypothetical protein
MEDGRAKHENIGVSSILRSYRCFCAYPSDSSISPGLANALICAFALARMIPLEKPEMKERGVCCVSGGLQRGVQVFSLVDCIPDTSDEDRRKQIADRHTDLIPDSRTGSHAAPAGCAGSAREGETSR